MPTHQPSPEFAEYRATRAAIAEAIDVAARFPSGSEELARAEEQVSAAFDACSDAIAAILRKPTSEAHVIELAQVTFEESEKDESGKLCGLAAGVSDPDRLTAELVMAVLALEDRR